MQKSGTTLHGIVGLLAAQWDIKFMHAGFWDRIVPAQQNSFAIALFWATLT